MLNQLTFESSMATRRLPFLPPGHPLRGYMANALLPSAPYVVRRSNLQVLLDYVPPVYYGWSPVVYPPWQPQRRARTHLVDFGSPPSEASTDDVLQFLHFASADHVVLDLKISHSRENPKFIVSERRVRIDHRESDLTVRVFDLPEHSVGQRIWACVLVFADFLKHDLPRSWEGRKLLFVLTDKSLVNAFRFPLIPTQQYSMLHNAAAEALLHLKRTIRLLPVDKDLFYRLPSPPPPQPLPPRARVTIHSWIADLEFGPSKRVMRLEVRKRSAAMHLTICDDVPRDHSWNLFHMKPQAIVPLGLLLPALDPAVPAKVYSTIARLATGHVHHGAYLQRFCATDPDTGDALSPECPCGTPIQTIEHVLRDCLFGDVDRPTLLLTGFPPQLNFATLLHLNAYNTWRFCHANFAFSEQFGSAVGALPPPLTRRSPSPLGDASEDD